MPTMTSGEEIKESFRKLTAEANKVTEANDYMETQNIANKKLDTDLLELDKQQKTNMR